MLFSSITFLYCFLPCVLLMYFVAPDRMKNLVLLLSSLFFYGWGEPKFLVFMLVSVTQSYIAALLIERFFKTKIAKLAFVLSAVASLGLLAYCKYADFFIENFNVLTWHFTSASARLTTETRSNMFCHYFRRESTLCLAPERVAATVTTLKWNLTSSSCANICRPTTLNISCFR